jgi:riboflavin kinase/FMN adenylyltransferase
MTERTIFALGFFDGVHIGHKALLLACRRLADEHGCSAGVITFTTHPDALVLGKAPALINTAQDRKRLLEAYSMDRVLELPFDRAMMQLPWQDFFRLLTTVYNAAGLVCGTDFRFGCRGAGNAQLLQTACREAGLPCAVVPEQKIDGITVSSTYIRALLEAGQLEQAVRFLGHPHVLTGTVISGRKLGRTLGIPTANLEIPAGVICPKHGVYACKAIVDGQQYLAVTNIGNRPTVDGHHTTVEPWLLDFTGDLYGKELTLEFYAYLRPEQKFPSLDALQEEIRKNAEQTRKIFQN